MPPFYSRITREDDKVVVSTRRSPRLSTPHVLREEELTMAIELERWQVIEAAERLGYKLVPADRTTHLWAERSVDVRQVLEAQQVDVLLYLRNSLGVMLGEQISKDPNFTMLGFSDAEQECRYGVRKYAASILVTFDDEKTTRRTFYKTANQESKDAG